jgi:hypothetical protein
VLYPAPLRDLLMEIAAARLFRAKWTAQIHEEWMSNLLAERPDLTSEHYLHSLLRQGLPKFVNELIKFSSVI